MTIDSRNSDGIYDDPHWEALARFHAGESTPDEAERMRSHLAAHPEDARLLEMLASSIDAELTVATEQRMSDSDVDKALVAVRRRLIAVDEPARPTLTVVHGNSPRASGTSNTSKSRRRQLAVLAVAAVLAIAVMSRDWTGASSSTAFTAGSQLIATATMQQDSLTLIDGTRIVVGAGSRITIDSGYNRDHRTVQLEGAALFTVAHDGSHPFIVRTTGADVEDIGTAFVVKTTTRGGVVVSVTDGSVRLTRAGQAASVELVAGDRATIAAAGETATVRRNVDTQADVAWTEGHLMYRDAPVAEVLADLSRWYGVEIVADSGLMGRTLQADLVTDSLPLALRVVSLALGADVTERDGRMFLVQHEVGRLP